MNFLNAKDLAAALAHYRAHSDYLLLAGGTDIVPAMRQGRGVPGLIGIGGVEELRGIEKEGEMLKVGALTTVSELLESPLVRAYCPLMEMACRVFGSKQIRNMATLGGNIGNASPAADLLPVLLVLKAELELRSEEGRRSLPATALFEGYKKLALMPGEIITTLWLPIEPGWEPYYRKVGRRNALNIAVASLAGLVRRRGEQIDALRLAAGSVNPFPVRLEHVETLLSGGRSDAERAAVVEALERDIAPHSGLRGSAAYRREVTANMIMECCHGVV